MTPAPLSPSRGTRRRPARRAVTLMELLVVLVVLSLLAGLAAPPLLSSLRSSRLTLAGNRVADLAMLGRQIAASRNVITALILVNSSPDAKLDRRALTLVEMDFSGSWKQTAGWLVLPEPLEFADNAAAPYATPPSPDTLQLKLGGQSVVDYHAVVFYPDGRMLGDPASPRKIRLALASPAGQAPPDNYYDLVFAGDTSGFRIVRP